LLDERHVGTRVEQVRDERPSQVEFPSFFQYSV
jgi:hypothetical protein